MGDAAWSPLPRGIAAYVLAAFVGIALGLAIIDLGLGALVLARALKGTP